MRFVNWLLRAFIFFVLFAFALNNQQIVTVNWFFGAQWQAPMVIVVLVVFASGCVLGVLAMLPGWWRHRKTVPGEAAAAARGVNAAEARAPAASRCARSEPTRRRPARRRAARRGRSTCTAG